MSIQAKNSNREIRWPGLQIRTRLVSCLILFFMLSFSQASTASAAVEKELKVKLAFIYNFAKFITWPEEVFKNEYDTIDICLTDYTKFEPAIISYEGKKIGLRNLKFIDLNTLTDTSVCNVVYLNRPPSKKLEFDFSRVGLVSIGNYEEMHDTGGVINFFTEQNKLRFSIDLTNAKKVGVSFNSRLLRLAKVIR